MFLIRFSVNNPLITNLLMILVVILGLGVLSTMPREMFPVVELDKIQIQTVFEGASPEEVERQITLPLEDALDTLTDIETMTSVSNEGFSSILLSLKPTADMDDLLRVIESDIAQIKDFPEQAEVPEIARLKTRFPVISVSVYGDVPAGQLFALSETVRRQILSLPGVGSAGLAGLQEWELWVEVDPYRLAAAQVSLAEIRQALRAGLADLPGGSLKGAEGDILLRGMGIPPKPALVRELVIRTNASGGKMRLGSLAKVQLRLEEAVSLGRFNGHRSVNVSISKTAEASSIEVADQVREFIRKRVLTLPSGIFMGFHTDLSEYVKVRLNTVKSSGILGLLFVLISLYLFLNFRVAAIAALGIPVSLLFAILILAYFGLSINMVSLFAFLLCLGLIVDDSIIVTENIYRHIEEGKEPHIAAQIGAEEVFWPVVASTATSIAAFAPMFAIGGTMGAFIMVIPIVVASALLGSYFEAFSVLPSHAAELLKRRKTKQKNRVWSHFLDRYQTLLRWSLINRYFVVVLSLGVLIISLTFAATRLPFKLFGDVEIGQFFLNIEAPITFSLQDSEKLAQTLEQEILTVLDEERELNSLLTNVGVIFIDFHRLRIGSHYIQFVVDLKKPVPKGFVERYVSPLVSLNFDPAGVRQRPTEAVINAIRARFAQIPTIQRFTILRPHGGPAGADIEIGVLGQDPVVLRQHAMALSALLEQIPGTQDVQQDMDPGKLEFQYRVNALGQSLGITQADIAQIIRSGFLGDEVLQVNDGGKRMPVRLIFPAAIRKQSDQFKHIPMTLSDGRVVYLGDVADIALTRGFSAIKHRNGTRLATITASVDDRVSTPLAVTAQFQQATAAFHLEHPNYELLFLGEKKESAESFVDMGRAMVIALVVIFFILSALFKSLLDPFVVMFAIPFGFVGVVIGHALLGYHLQFLSMIGFLALAGVVVNDSLILVEFAKRRRAQGMARLDAMVLAGKVRIRPILITSITTFLGVSPLIFFSTGQTAFLAPMAVSLGFGLLFATVLILLVLPCLYLIADDGRRLFWA